ncbi:MAG: hydratase [Burkholderiaceae bacterium]|nr:hydratase [Burkholderiaceae bacterium]
MACELSSELLLDAVDGGRTFARDEYLPLRDLARAEALQTGITVARIARGERAVGYKIGFTNRSIWPLYGVFHPIWAPVWNSTLRLVDATPAAIDAHAVDRAQAVDEVRRAHGKDAGDEVPRVDGGDVDLSRYAQPRLEPEIVVGLRTAPREPTPQAVFEAADWYAHGFEIVQCPYPQWRFTAAEAFAAQGLHGALLVGPRRPLRELGEKADEAIDRLGALRVSLYRDDALVAQGCGREALDGPLHAIAHLAHELALRGHSIEAGAIVTTGTLTDAQPLAAGQRWTSRIEGAQLPGLAIRTVQRSRTSTALLR